MKPLGITCVALLLFSCASPRTKWVVEAEDISLQEEMLDTLVITDDSDDLEATPRTFRPSARQTYDILHTKLSLSFDWKKQHVYGVAEIQWKPYFFPVRTLVFDAVGFEIHKITTKDSR
ncbi:MAG: alanyl aminopeptidase, partial [Saprospiraceae bacterium]|nr:alanyl aminopeptidase [Saprospiraceae bacterium]